MISHISLTNRSENPNFNHAYTSSCRCSTELFSYEDCIFYTVVTAVATLPRTQLKARVVDAPEILTVIDAIPHLAPFLTALYACDYKTLFQARPMRLIPIP